MTDASVSVRMYNVGFGDCFLLSVPDGEAVRRILIDCGTHPSSTGEHSATDASRQLVADLSEGGSTPRLDVVVATHRHRDHVSGFSDAELWRQVEVGEVWLPWTEDPEDPAAVRLLNRMSGVALALDTARGFMPASPALTLATAIIENSLKNEKPMQTLHQGFAGSPRRRFLSVGTDLSSAPLGDAKVHVLGPSRDEQVIRTLDPPKEESWMTVVEAAPDTDGEYRAFDEGWAIGWDEFHATKAFEELRPGGQIVGAIRRVAADELLFAAASLEKAVNGTSLVLVFEIGELLLVFPGDAQWGTWKAILDDVEMRSLIQRASFYKIGHHGSHNATPATFVREVLASNVWAALPFAKVEIWPSIPHPELLAALTDKHARILRSDEPPANPEPEVTVRSDISIDLAFATDQ
jgi:beta-lactamase superfamily II metal-dependent hydrolase